MNSHCDMNPNNLNFYGGDPGAVKHGNFINYYSFHDVKERINNLHPQMFPTPANNKIFCLDVGCNTGELTKAVHNYLKTIYPNCEIQMLAIDIDSTLIDRAKESYNNLDITFNTSNIMALNDRSVINTFLEKYKSETFDVTFCFSVTMWIHLNNGDDGLLEFLKYIKSISKTIIIEPQPWKCYRNAQRRVKKSGHIFDLYDTITIKSKVDVFIENAIGEGSHRKVYESPNSSWDRKIQSFQFVDQAVDKFHIQ